LASHLFSLREYAWALSNFVDDAITELKNRQFPLLGKIETVYVESLPRTRSTLPSGEIVESQPLEYRLEFPIELRDSINGDSSSLVASIAGAAEQKGHIETQSMLEYAGRITHAAGTSTDAKGRSISRHLILEMMEKPELEFGEDGYPIIPSEVRHLFHRPSQTCACFTDSRSEHMALVMSGENREKLMRLPPLTEEEIGAFEDLMSRKRKQWNDSRRHRQLS
jgi:hypothetical protein